MIVRKIIQLIKLNWIQNLNKYFILSYFVSLWLRVKLKTMVKLSLFCVIIKMVVYVNSIEKKVKEKIKEYSNDDYLIEYIKNEYSLNDGSADIILKVGNKNDLFDSRTFGKQLNLKI